MKPAMRIGWTLPLLALILSGLACNWSEVAPPDALEIEPSPWPTFAIPTLTPVPTETPLPTPTSTPDAPVAVPKTLGVNCRYGPGQDWEVVSTIPEGTSIEIKGRTIDTTWWYALDPMQLDERFCWVAYDAVDSAGNLNVVPIIEPPAASVTDLDVHSAVVTFNACGGPNQVTFNGAIRTNGPGTVTYHWEVSGAAQQTAPDETLAFNQSGAQNVTAILSLTECGAYSAILRVTEPNSVVNQKEFDIQSP